jgi:hypothetical protein
VKRWTCPLCVRECDYGRVGCDDPQTCDEPKNVHYAHYREWYAGQREDVRGVGISEIANAEESAPPRN